MVLIKEFRITLPMSVEEYNIGQLYNVAEVSRNETGGGEGVEVLKNEPFENVPLLGGKFSKGQYTKKIYHLASKVPYLVRSLAPTGSLEVHEEAWNAYPYCKTVLTNPGYMKENFIIKIESFYRPSRGEEVNVHELSQELLNQREVIQIDIAKDEVTPGDYKSDEDPKTFTSTKTGRGPLTSPTWKNEVEPVMTCYKLVTIEFKWWGIQKKVEDFIFQTEKRLFLNQHRQVFCWIDKWHGLTIEDIRAIEDQTQEDLEKLRNTGEVRGTRA